VAYARRALKETARFEAKTSVSPGLLGIWRTVSARRVLQVGAIWFLCYLCTQNAVMFWKEFAVGERALSDAAVGGIVAISALASMPVAFAAGYFLDAVGRRVGGTVILGVLATGVLISYTASGKLFLTLGLVLATIGLNTTLTLMNTLTTELFPTEQRGAAFAWSNNLIGRVGNVLSPFAIGKLAESLGWGLVLRSTAIFPVIACALIWLLLPETKGRELEDTAEARA
jgi:putative MFS transporter